MSDTGMETPRGTEQGYAGVGVRVWYLRPLENSYPCEGYGGYKYLLFLLIYCMNLNKFVIYTVPFQLIWPTCDFPMFSKNLRKSENLRKNISRVRKKWGTGDGQIYWNGTVYTYIWNHYGLIILLLLANNSKSINHCISFKIPQG